jgi:plasmid maintenance system antidote protein VapI
VSASRSSLSVEPISELSPKQLARQMAARLGGRPEHHERTIHRARLTGGLTAETADRIAISLGTHPVLIWGEAWER